MHCLLVELFTSYRKGHIAHFTIRLLKPVDEDFLLLTISPDPRHRLLVIGWIPIRVVHYQSICTNQIQAASAGFAAKHEDKIAAIRIVEAVDDFLTFSYSHRAIQTNELVSP